MKPVTVLEAYEMIKAIIDQAESDETKRVILLCLVEKIVLDDAPMPSQH